MFRKGLRKTAGLAKTAGAIPPFFYVRETAADGDDTGLAEGQITVSKDSERPLPMPASRVSACSSSARLGQLPRLIR